VYEPYGANGLWYEMQLKIAEINFSKWKEGLVTWI
jgi:long-chain acyl-CoA synthetase